MVFAITEHFDIWTTAQIAKTIGRGNGSIAQNPYGIKKLRELILELAVRGKLVPQEPNDEPVPILLENIAKEKAQLVQAGKIREQKPLQLIGEAEKPFPLPKGWEWARLPAIALYKPGKTPSTKNPLYWADNSSDLPWVSISDMQHFGMLTKTQKYITQEAVDQVFKCDPVPAGTILMSFKLTVGKISILDIDAYHNEAIISIQPFPGISNEYLFKILPNRALAGNTKGALMGDTLNATSLGALLVPIPPTPEQHRIVAKVDELMGLCNQLEQQQSDSKTTHQTLVETLLSALTKVVGQKEVEEAWQLIANHFDTLLTSEDSIDQLKKTILQLAVTGRLVSQNPNDEPAHILLEKIAEEKTRLIKEGKIHKQKPVPDISECEKPFALPKGWDYVRLGNVTDKIGSGSTPRGGESSYVVFGIPFLRSQNIWNHGLELDDVAYISDETHQSMSNTVVIPGDLLLNITGASLGRCTVFPEGLGEANVSQHVTIIRPTNSHTVRYLHLCILSPYTQALIWGRQVGMAREGLSKKVLELFEIPMPPLAEQRRIVAKVEELLTICDALKSRLSEIQATQIQLADAIVERSIV